MLPARSGKPETRTFSLAVVWVPLLSVGLTALFWWPMWEGAGLIGGDLYTYFFPQKTFLVDRLRHGEIPLWNTLVGHGYPLVAESQTGLFYPFHLAYALFDVNTAYNVVQLLHYVLAFLFTWLYARSLNMSALAAVLVGLVYVYGWFPARLCLEWAIIGGAWFPCALWSVEKFLATRYWRYLILLCVSVSLQILPGHFNIAFLTLLTLCVHLPCRLFWTSVEHPIAAPPRQALQLLCIALICAGTLSAVQLLPTWELKQISQRAVVNAEHDPRYGNLPFWYWQQVATPWIYARPDIDSLLNAGLPPSASTNKVEAHLYFGLIPLVMLAGMMVTGRLFRERSLLVWFVIGTLALLYTPGWLVPITRAFPGFSFFKGPARFGLITTFAVAVIAGRALDLLQRKCRPSAAFVLAFCIVGLTVADLWYVSRQVGYVTLIPRPVLSYVADSPVRQILLQGEQPTRLFSRGANLPTNLGIAATPEYLGIGPAEYYSAETILPRPLPYEQAPTSEQLDWLRRAAVTHILAHKPLELCGWPENSYRSVWSGHDPFLNRAWGRPEPLFLYEFLSGRQRLSWEHPQPGDRVQLKGYGANQVVAEVETKRGDTLVLADLNYPGWQVTIDGQAAPQLLIDRMYRGVVIPAGKHSVIWTYRPASIFYGAIISLVTVLFLATVGHIRFWHPPQSSSA